MKTTRTSGRGVAFALVLGTLALTAPNSASACEGGYTVQSGDTFGAIAQRCDTTVAALAAANDVNPHRLQIGQVLNVPGDTGPVVRESSKTAPTADVADSAQTEMERLAAEYPDAVLSVAKGEWRLTVDISAEKLSPNETVRVAVGDGKDWITLGDITADENGEFTSRARIPAQMADAPALRFAIKRPWGDHEAFTYVRDDAAARTAERRKGQIVVAGKVVSGGSCDLLITRSGESYALADSGNLRPGARVIVTGSTGGSNSGCIGGHAELQVRSIEPQPSA